MLIYIYIYSENTKRFSVVNMLACIFFSEKIKINSTKIVFTLLYAYEAHVYKIIFRPLYVSAYI